MAPTLVPLQFVADAVSPEASLAIAVAVTIAFAVLVVVALVLAARHAILVRKITALADDHRALTPGPVTLVGTVETDPVDVPAIEVAVTQHRDPKLRYDEKRRRDYYVWRETSRVQRARPFVLRRANGEAVTVVPDQTTFLVDALDQRVYVSDGVRTCGAALEHGERVRVTGTLAPSAAEPVAVSDYRSSSAATSGPSMVVQRTATRLLKVSTDVEADAHRARLNFHLVGIMVVVVVALWTQFALMDFWQLRADGVAVVAHVTSVEHFSHPADGRRAAWSRNVLHARIDDGGIHSEIVEMLDDPSRAASQPGVGTPVRFVVLPGHPSVHQWRTTASLDVLFGPLALFGWATCAIFLVGIELEDTSWRARRRLVDDEFV